VTLPALLGIDTNCFVYYSESEGPRFRFVAEFVFGPLLRATMAAVASNIALAELLVPDLRAGDIAAADELESSLLAFPSLSVVPVTNEITRRAAEIRAAHRLRLIDAIHIATAAEAGAGAFLTNDREFLRAASVLPVLILDDLVQEAR
jgi:predicted nucleic acid-binding protein